MTSAGTCLSVASLGISHLGPSTRPATSTCASAPPTSRSRLPTAAAAAAADLPAVGKQAALALAGSSCDNTACLAAWPACSPSSQAATGTVVLVASKQICDATQPWTLDGGAGRGGKGGRGGQTRADAASLGRAASAMADGRHLCLCFSQATVSGHDATRYVGDCAAWTVAASSRDDQRARPGAERSSRHPAPPSDYPPSPASRAIGHCSPAMPFSRPRRSGTLLSLGWIRPKLAFNRHLVHAPKWEALTSCSRCTMLVSGGCVV